MNNIEVKKHLLEEIEQNVEIFKRVNDIQYRIRCPFCGDSQSNPRDTHMYLKCDLNNPNEPILYNCFRGNCGAKGFVNNEFMKRLGIDSKWIKETSHMVYNKIPSYKEAKVELITGEVNMDSPQVKYVESRLGKGFIKEDYERMKIIWNWDGIIPYITSKSTLNTLPNNKESISFLSDDKSFILSRGFDEDCGWRKIGILNKNGGMSTYNMKSVFSLFTKDMIYINIAEGIFDILSVYKNFNDGENSVFIAALGSDYIGALNYAIGKGLIGNNVVVKIYIDDNISDDKLCHRLRKYKYYFNKISVFRNIKYKDIGITLDKIELKEYPVK